MSTHLAPVARHEFSVYVEFGCFLLRNLMGDGPTLDQPDRLIAGVSDGGILLQSAGNDFYPTVRLEIWPGWPPPAPGSWDLADEDTFETGTTDLYLDSLMGSRAGQISLPDPGAYRVRAYCRGRDEAAWLRGHILNYRGVEEWLVQLWADDWKDDQGFR